MARLALALAATGLGGCVMDQPEPQIVFWKAGEDALTSRLHAALEGPSLPDCTTPCIVALVRDVRPAVDGRLAYGIDVSAPSNVETTGAKLGEIEGVCADVDLSPCAADIRARVQALAGRPDA